MPASVFEGFDYVALGHLHRPQSVGGGRIGKDRVQYAGSLLKYSKSEINHEKSVTLIDVDGKGQVQFERLPLSVPREFRLVDGTLETIIEQAEAQERAADKNDYIYALLRDKGPVYDAMARLRSVSPNAVHLEQPGFVPEGAMALPNAEARRRSVPELFADFFETVQGEPLSDVERATLLEVLDEARVGEVLK